MFVVCAGEERVSCLLSFSSWCLMSHDGCVALARGAMGFSAVCDCGIS